jgi:hypothetical protein
MGDGGKDNRHGPARKRAGEGRDQTGNQYKCCPTAAVLFPSAYSGQYGRACMRPGSSCSSPLDTTLPHLKPALTRWGENGRRERETEHIDEIEKARWVVGRSVGQPAGLLTDSTSSCMCDTGDSYSRAT